MKKSKITVLEAVDNLSHLAELDIEEAKWLDPAKIEENQETIRETFRTLNFYLQHLYQKERAELNNSQMQKGLQAMMQLAGEAVDKVEKYTELFKGAHVQEEPISEYKQLQHFYLSKVFSKIKKDKGEEPWEAEGAEPELLAERQALKDLEAVQQDREYEFFYLSKEDGTPFVSSHLLRHIRMVGNFDEGLDVSGRENFLKQMEVVLDRDMHVSAQEILREGSDLIDRFFKEALHHKEQLGANLLTKAVMALMLAANPKNLLHNTVGKSAVDYFKDFEVYLRGLTDSEEYTHWRKQSDKAAPFKSLCLKLTHSLCNALFLRSGARHDILRFIKASKDLDRPSVWGTLASIENTLRDELRRCPNGPLMKILELFRHEGEKIGFDPLLQKNLPSQIFTLASERTHTTILHLPCPIHQNFIEKARIAPEFKGYLRSLTGRKHLYFNLQDRTSWKEHARCSAIESLAKEGEFSETLTLVTLAKGTDFYHQLESYAEITKAADFTRLCAEQILSGVESGFYFPPNMISSSLVHDLVTFVHQDIFGAKASLNRKERLDFIEILYFFLTLRILETVKADVMSLSCKDGVDTGAAAAAEFYGFSRLLSTSRPWTKEDKNFFIFAFFSPALLVRHRLIAPWAFQRALSALEYFEAVMQDRRDQILKSYARLFPDLPIGKINITEVA